MAWPIEKESSRAVRNGDVWTQREHDMLIRDLRAAEGEENPATQSALGEVERLKDRIRAHRDSLYSTGVPRKVEDDDLYQELEEERDDPEDAPPPDEGPPEEPTP